MYNLIILKKSLVKVSEKLKKILFQLNLRKTNDCVIYLKNSSLDGLVKKIQHKIVQRQIDSDTLKNLFTDPTLEFPLKLKVSNSLDLEKDLDKNEQLKKRLKLR